jgi:hypothetical protein
MYPWTAPADQVGKCHNHNPIEMCTPVSADGLHSDPIRAAAAGYIIHVSSLKYKQTLTAGESQINTTS